MSIKKFGVALAAGLVAMACATPAALAADAVKDAEAKVSSAQADVDWFCTEGTDYYDMAGCADAQAALADAQAKLKAAKDAASANVVSPVPDQTKADLADAKLDATWFCAEGTEYYDMVKCADAQARLGAGSGSGVNPDAPAVNPDNSQADATKSGVEAKAPKAKEAKGGLAKTGAIFAPLMGLAAAISLAGGVMVARKRA